MARDWPKAAHGAEPRPTGRWPATARTAARATRRAEPEQKVLHNGVPWLGGSAFTVTPLRCSRWRGVVVGEGGALRRDCSTGPAPRRPRRVVHLVLKVPWTVARGGTKPTLCESLG